MLIAIPDVLSAAAARDLRARLAAADWIDGNATSGAGAALAKRNLQLPEDHPVTQAAQQQIGAALGGCDLFLSAALPHTVFPPLFNWYRPEHRFDLHVDNAIRLHAASGTRIRTDLSATLFLTDLDDYEGGALEIEGSFGKVAYRLPAGHMLLYPATSLHRVTPVTRGDRISAFFWIQSLVPSAEDRAMLFDLDQAVQTLALERGADDAQVLRLTGVYHNLVRRLAQN